MRNRVSLFPLAFCLIIGCSSKMDIEPGGILTRERPGRIIDVHLHANTLDADVLPPGMIAQSVGVQGMNIRAPFTNDELRDSTIAELRRMNVTTAILSGHHSIVLDWAAKEPDLFLKGVMIGAPPISHALDEFTPDEVSSAVSGGHLDVLGEITTQYLGIKPDSDVLERYFSVAEDVGIPVHIHTAGLGAPISTFRSGAGRPMFLEPVLTSHPRLRIYVENAGYPYLEDMLALFFQYPERLYADVSTMLRILPREETYRYLKILVDAGFGNRLMFGSDQGIWPAVIAVEVDILNEAPFLTDQQRDDIFYGNAARFFELSNERSP